MPQLIANHIRIYCKRLEVCHTFYTQLLCLPVVEYKPMKGYALYQAGHMHHNITLVLEQVIDTHEIKNLVGKMSGLTFNTNDIEAAFNELSAKGVIFTTDLKRQTWGGYLAKFIDPDNNTLLLAGR